VGQFQPGGRVSFAVAVTQGNMRHAELTERVAVFQNSGEDLIAKHGERVSWFRHFVDMRHAIRARLQLTWTDVTCARSLGAHVIQRTT
jgi:hypothetical protein